MAVWNRALPVPNFTLSQQGTTYRLHTAGLQLTYDTDVAKGPGLTAQNLFIDVRSRSAA